MRIFPLLLLAPLAHAWDPDDTGTSMPGELPAADDADFECDWTLNGVQGTSTHTYSSAETTYAIANGALLWLDTGPSRFLLTLTHGIAVPGGHRYHGHITGQATDLACSVRIAADGTTVDYQWCRGTLNGLSVTSMDVACDEL